MWYEICGGSGLLAIGQPNTIVASEGKCSQSGACPDPHASLLGKTKKSDTEIAEFNTAYLAKHPTYKVITDNCQTYVTDFFDFLMEDGEPDSVNTLPSKQSPLSSELKEEEEEADHLPATSSAHREASRVGYNQEFYQPYWRAY